MQRAQIEVQLLEACRRLAAKGFFNTPRNSFSLRLPGAREMILACGLEAWRRIGIADLETASLLAREGLSGLHASIYQARLDAGAVAISSPRSAGRLAAWDGLLPPLFDEQVRRLGLSAGPLPDEAEAHGEMLRQTFRRGANAALLGDRLLCLGMTSERVLFNTELYEKCARAYVIARASGGRIRCIPRWVQLIANRRLLKDERRAAASYRNGHIPDGINSY